MACSHATENRPIRVHQVISGFTQTEARPTGLFRVAETLHDRGFNNRVSRVRLNRWNDDWSSIAEYLWLLGQHHRTQVLVNIYAYSWGVGWGAIQLAKELQRRDVPVQTLVSGDGVYRHKFFRLPAMLGRNGIFSPSIRIPANVHEVRPFHQTVNRPQGHVLTPGKGFSGIIHDSQELHATHEYIDDHPTFLTACLRAAEALQGVS